MPLKILMPALSPTMTEGEIGEMAFGEGEEINSGDVIAEIETDKATMEVEAVEEGKLGKILVPEGTEGVAVNNVIALLLEEGEDDYALDGVDVSAAPSGGNGGTPPAAAEPAAPAPSAPAPQSAAAPDAPAAPAPQPAASGERIIASPLARRMASQAGLDLAGVSGTGPNGGIVKADVEAAIAGGASAAPAAASAAPAIAPAAPTTAETLPFEPEFELEHFQRCAKRSPGVSLDRNSKSPISISPSTAKSMNC